MKPFDKLEIDELIDLLANYSLHYAKLKKEMAYHKKLNQYKSIVESLMEEIDRRKRAVIRPYNDISPDLKDDQIKTA